MPRPSLTTSSGATRRNLAWWLSALGTLLIVLTPLWCAAIAFHAHWVPSSDWAVVVSKGMETFSAHPPLVGQWTSLSSYVGFDVNQPGPLQFWMQGVTEWLFAPSVFGALLGQALLSTAAAVVFLLAARRRGGTSLVGPAAALLALLFHAPSVQQIIRSPYNPSAAVIGLIASSGRRLARSSVRMTRSGQCSSSRGA